MESIENIHRVVTELVRTGCTELEDRNFLHTFHPGSVPYFFSDRSFAYWRLVLVR